MLKIKKKIFLKLGFVSENQQLFIRGFIAKYMQHYF